MNSPEWVAIGISLVTSIVMCAVLFAKVSVASANNAKDQESTRRDLKEMSTVLHTLATESRVASSKYEEITRRLSQLERDMGGQAEVLRRELRGINETVARCRTAIHMCNNKIMEIDPAWRPYQGYRAEPQPSEES